MFKSKKQALATERLQINKRKRQARRAGWLLRLSKRRGLVVEELPCQDGNKQLVTEVVEAGGAYFYKSCACSGCPEGANALASAKSGDVMEVTKSILGCSRVKNNHLVSLKKVTKGEVVLAKRPSIQ
jgi:hypothetical protein